MKKLSTGFKINSVLIVLIFAISINASAQLHGVYTINKALPASSANYQNFTSAIGDLNTGVRTDGGPVNGPNVSASVTFNVTAGQEFHESLLLLTATGTAADTIAFVRSGTGKNPLIKAPFGTGKQVDGNGGGPGDVMLTLKGASYITFNGINIADTGSFNTVAGNTDVYRMETGVVLTNASSARGCQHDRIENCNITMDSLYGSSGYNYGYTFGIDCYNSVALSAFSGTNSYNEFDGDTIPNDNYPIYFVGDGTYHDHGNLVGKNKGNYIPAFGMGINMQWGNGTYGIDIFGNEDSVVIANNYIANNRVHFATEEFGIIVWGAGSNNTITGVNTLTIYNNTILNINWANAQFNGAALGINNNLSGTLSIYNNNLGNVTPCSYGFDGYAYILDIDGSSAAVTNIYGNYIHDLVLSSPTTCGVCNELAPMGIYAYITGGPVNIWRNHIENIAINNTANIKGNVYGINNLYGNALTRCDSNRFDNFSSNASVGMNGGVTYYGGNIEIIGGAGPATYNYDTVDNFSFTGTGSSANNTGYPYAFSLSGTYNHCVAHDISCGANGSGAYGFTGTGTLNNCKIYNISASGAVNAIGANSNSSINLSNDTIYGISSVTGTAAGVMVTGGSAQIKSNMVYGFSSSGAGTDYGMYISGINASDVVNNMINSNAATSADTSFPLYLENISNTTIFFNSINTNTAGVLTGFSVCYLDGFMTNVQLLDNIFSYSATSGTGEPFYSTGNTFVPAIFDHNIFYNAGSANQATFNSTTYTNSTLIGGGTYNTYSQVINPFYVSSLQNLHITSQCQRGVAIGGITTDIDGQTRANPPCIGADEIPPSNGTVSTDTTVCTGATLVLHVSGGTSYLWSTGSTADSIIVTNATDTTYVASINNSTCTASDTFHISTAGAVAVHITPPAPVLCPGGSVILSIGNQPGSFAWSPATGLAATTGDSVIATPTATVTYTVTSTGAGCTATDTDVVTVSIAPNKPKITLSVTGDTLLSSAQNGNQWYKNGTAINGATDSILVITGLPVDTYRVVVTDIANGCSTTSDSLVTSGIGQLSVINNQVSIYPNPTNGSVFVKINPSAANVNDWSLQVTDVLGRTLYTRQSLNYTNAIDLSNLPGGVYFITISNKQDSAVFAVVRGN